MTHTTYNKEKETNLKDNRCLNRINYVIFKINPMFSVNKLTSIHQLHIKRIHTQENAFRFGFASMNEPELEEAVSCLKAALKN